METYANGMVEDEMISSLSFKIDPTANYVTSRQSVTYNAQGSNIYQSGAGSRVIRFNITGTGQYLDPSTVRFVYTLKNNGGANQVLFPLGGPWSFFRRCRIYSGAGAVLEDIDYANRVHEMFHILTSKQNRHNDINLEGFGLAWDDDTIISATDGAPGGTLRDRLAVGSIPPGGQRTVSFKPLFGIFNQPKMIPLQWLPLTAEFELCTGVDDAIATALNNSLFPAATTSNAWQIEDCQIKADVIELDSAVHNEYASHLMQGHPIPINYTSYITQLQSIANGTIAINITRSCSRLKSVFINFDQALAADATRSKTLIKKPWNSFFHPMGMGAYNYQLELQVQMLVGNKTFPVFPMRSGAEQYYQLKKSLGIHGSAFHSISIDTLAKYMNDHYIVGIDTEKVLGASFSGINCRQDLITIQAKGANATIPGANNPDQIYVILQPDYVVEIRESGVLVID